MRHTFRQLRISIVSFVGFANLLGLHQFLGLLFERFQRLRRLGKPVGRRKYICIGSIARLGWLGGLRRGGCIPIRATRAKQVASGRIRLVLCGQRLIARGLGGAARRDRGRSRCGKWIVRRGRVVRTRGGTKQRIGFVRGRLRRVLACLWRRRLVRGLRRAKGGSRLRRQPVELVGRSAGAWLRRSLARRDMRVGFRLIIGFGIIRGIGILRDETFSVVCCIRFGALRGVGTVALRHMKVDLLWPVRIGVVRRIGFRVLRRISLRVVRGVRVCVV